MAATGNVVSLGSVAEPAVDCGRLDAADLQEAAAGRRGNAHRDQQRGGKEKIAGNATCRMDDDMNVCLREKVG